MGSLLPVQRTTVKLAIIIYRNSHMGSLCTLWNFQNHSSYIVTFQADDLQLDEGLIPECQNKMDFDCERYVGIPL